MIKEYIKKLKKLLQRDVIIQYGVYGKYKLLDLEDLYYVKDSSKGLKIKVVTLEGVLISNFTLVQMHGCCGICISTGTYVNSNFRNKGVNTLLNNFRIDIAKYLGYGLLMCTDLESNVPQIKTLDKNGWKHIYKFQNPRTRNILNVTIKEL